MARLEFKSYSGSGVNGTNFTVAIENANRRPSIRTMTAGSTWGFSRLEIGVEYTKCSIGHITKIAPKKETTVYLNPFGYIFFRTKNVDEDFGFSKLLSPAKILNELESLGYRMDESCERNLLISKLVGYAFFAVFTTAITFLVVMAIIDPPKFN